MKTWLFNPFKYIAGNKALWLGIGAMLVTAALCLLTHEHLDGVIDVHVGRVVPSYVYFIEPFIDWLCLLLPLYIFGAEYFNFFHTLYRYSRNLSAKPLPGFLYGRISHINS